MKLKKQVRRFDLGELRQMTRTPQGFLLCPGFATRVGVFPYMNADGSVRRELRHPDDVFAPESLATLKNAPFTLEHPPEMVTPKNVAKYRKGHTTDRVEVNRDMVDVDVIIEDQDAIDAVEKEGIRELSCGYEADVVEEEGVYNGTPYDCRQKNIKYNHLAGVRRGRAGPEVRLRLDSADAVMQKPAENTFSQESAVSDAEEGEALKTKKVVITGREVDLPSDVADTIQDFMDRFDEMRATVAQLKMEAEMKVKKQDQKDVDISQPGVSPQVKVEQQTPDGRKAPGKTAAAPGSITGGPSAKADDEEEEKGDEDVHGSVGGVRANSAAAGGKAVADDEEEKKGDDEEKKEDDEPAAQKGMGAAMSPLESLKRDLSEMDSYDAMKAKMDEFAAASMNQPEKGPEGAKMDSAEIETRARARAKLERHAEKLVPYKTVQKFDSMSDNEIMAAVIKHRHPSADLKGKSKVYLQTRFDSIVEALAEEGTESRKLAGKAMLGLGGGRMDSEERADADPEQARLKMIRESRELHRQPLSVSKK